MLFIPRSNICLMFDYFFFEKIEKEILLSSSKSSLTCFVDYRVCSTDSNIFNNGSKLEKSEEKRVLKLVKFFSINFIVK